MMQELGGCMGREKGWMGWVEVGGGVGVVIRGGGLLIISLSFNQTLTPRTDASSK